MRSRSPVPTIVFLIALIATLSAVTTTGCKSLPPVFQSPTDQIATLEEAAGHTLSTLATLYTNGYIDDQTKDTIESVRQEFEVNVQSAKDAIATNPDDKATIGLYIKAARSVLTRLQEQRMAAERH